MKKKYVYLFSEGNANMREILGGKGANLAEMTRLGLPFTSLSVLVYQTSTTMVLRSLNVKKLKHV